MEHSKNKGKSEMLPPPPPPPMTRLPMVRKGFASRGRNISLLTNHFKVSISKTEGHFYHYSVSIKYEDDSPVDAKGVGRRILNKVHETYISDLQGKTFAYDGEKSLFTVGPLPHNKMEFIVILDEVTSNRKAGSEADEGLNEADRKRSRRQTRSKTYKVDINYAAKIPLQAITDALRGQHSDHFQEAVRVLDIILRQHAAQKPNCLLVRQSFFHDELRNYVELGGGVRAYRGFHSSFRATQTGLSLNMDVSTTMIVRPGAVIDFLKENQSVRDYNQIDWKKAKRMLKNLRIKATTSNLEYKITGLSDRICREQTFLFKQRREGTSEAQEEEITVYDYFVRKRNIKLTFSANFPCINVGKPKRPVYIPVELCSLVSLQRYTKALTNPQRASFVEKSRQKPQDRMDTLEQAMITSNYAANTLLQSCGISISSEFTRIQGRVLPAPRLRVGNEEDIVPGDGRWNFNQKKLVAPINLEDWAVVNFSARCDVEKLCKDLIRCGEMKGMRIAPPKEMFIEKPQFTRSSALVRVNEMFKMMQTRLPDEPPKFLLCILPERKNSDLYGPWKKRNLCDFGVVTQCIAPTAHLNNQYLTNVLLKINAKLGGINSYLCIERSRSIPIISKVPTFIVGMDVSHGSPGRSDVPSIAAVVSSRQWPSISTYRAAVSTQSPKLEMIDSLFNKVSDTEDRGVFRGLVKDFYDTSQKRKPENIIIFRDGVSESQFNQVLNVELEQIIQACKFMDESWSPKFMVVVAQKNHHTKFFQVNSPKMNVPPGTVIDNGICHPRTNDFYMCAHAGRIGTTRPTHYHVLYDEIGFSPDDLQELVHSLSYVYQRSTTAISVVAPICYAHLAAAQMSQFVKFDEFSDRSSSHSGTTSEAGGVPVPQLPVLHENIQSTMFFC